jgi:hypothetical protein
MPRDSKIFQLFKELEMSSEFTELLSDFTISKDNSMPAFSTIPLGLSSQLIRDQLFKKLETKIPQMKILHSLTQENITPLKRMRLHFLETLESLLNNMLVNTMSSPMICIPP